MTNYKDKTLPPVAAADLVDANGSCAGAAPPVTASGEGVPMIPAAIALEMSECDVVKRAGVAEKVEIGTNDRRERTATLTYINGQRPGHLSFHGWPADRDGARARTGLGEAREEAGQAGQARGPPSQVSVQ